MGRYISTDWMTDRPVYEQPREHCRRRSEVRAVLEGTQRDDLDDCWGLDQWRIKHRKEGDPENERISKTERASSALYGAVSEGYEPPKGSKAYDKADGWVNDLGADAAFNFESYASASSRRISCASTSKTNAFL